MMGGILAAGNAVPGIGLDRGRDHLTRISAERDPHERSGSQDPNAMTQRTPPGIA